MAVMKMMELVDTGLYDTIIVDTPPAQNAQQFFEAPEKIQHPFPVRAYSGSPPSPWIWLMNFAKASLKYLIFWGSETIGEISDFFGLFKQSAMHRKKWPTTVSNCWSIQTPSRLIEVPNRRLYN